jgi:hypothetical protein
MKNVIQRPQKQDHVGAITFALVLVSQYFEFPRFVQIGCFCITAAGAGYAVVVVSPKPKEKLAKQLRETEFYVSVLKPCLISSALFWLFACVAFTSIQFSINDGMMIAISILLPLMVFVFGIGIH